MRRLLVITFLITLWNSVVAQPKNDGLIKEILAKSESQIVRKVMEQPDTFRLQIIYTQINRDQKNTPSFKNFYFNFDNSLYFNPASTVKLPLALLSLEKLNRINRSDVNKFTTIQFDSSYEGQIAATRDVTAENNLPTIAHYIKKAFLVSDNDAYNRMYQFVGQREINAWLREKDYKHTRINRQFMGFNEEQNRHTNQVRFLDPAGNVVFTQPPGYNTAEINFDRVIKIGNGHIDKNDSLIHSPIDFTHANIVGLEDLQRMLQSALFPQSVALKQRFNLTKDDEVFVLRYLSQYPSETNYPKYDTSQYYDSYVKFYFRYGSHQMPPHVRVFNKVGWAYGFLTDVSYVVDFKNKVEFMLTTTLYTNTDGILNDDRYDYEEIGWPFLYELGQAVYQYELNRSRKFSPDLQKFKIHYEKRNLSDTRIPIKDVDN